MLIDSVEYSKKLTYARYVFLGRRLSVLLIPISKIFDIREFVDSEGVPCIEWVSIHSSNSELSVLGVLEFNKDESSELF